MKKIILSMLLASASLLYSDNGIVVQGSSTGRGQTKAEAYAEAIGRLPGNATPVGTSYNGYSSQTGGKLDYGNYTCTIRWKKF